MGAGGSGGLTVWGGGLRRCPHVGNFYNFHIENHVIFEPIIIHKNFDFSKHAILLQKLTIFHNS